jgi:hypothetical protein
VSPERGGACGGSASAWHALPKAPWVVSGGRPGRAGQRYPHTSQESHRGQRDQA